MNKAALKRLAIELRAEIGIGVHDRFDPYVLAELYGVDVLKLSEVGCSPEALRHFGLDRAERFSGALVPIPDGSTVIVENDWHAPERRMSTASHEMSHVTLEHPFTVSFTDSNGCRATDREREAEADELSGELLVPSDAARQLAFDRVSDEAVARRFGVSVQFASWRMNVSGARKIASRAFAKRRA